MSQNQIVYKGPALAAWILIVLTCLVALIPGIGFLTWVVGGPILLVTLILGIVVLAKGGTLQGVFILLASLIAAPVFLVVAPIITTGGLLAASAEHQKENIEEQELESEANQGEGEQETSREQNGNQNSQNTTPGIRN